MMNIFEDKTDLDEYLTLTTTKSVNPFKQSDILRRCITFTSSTDILDGASKSIILDKHLTEFSNVTQNGNIYNSSIKTILEQTNSSNNSFQWKSNLSNIDVASKIPANVLHRNNEKELQLFCKIFNKKSGTIPKRNTDRNLKVKSTLNAKNDNAEESRFLPKINQNANIDIAQKSHNYKNDKAEESIKNTDMLFKTARDELNLQNFKKNGNNNDYIQPRKRLGMRRAGPGKFVSPMLPRTDSNDSSKSQDFANEIVDERLKNIDPKMVELIKSEIMDPGSIVDWNDIAGLEFAKTAIQEAVVWPMLRPDIFTGLRRPPKGILLFGPPGTGKTLIGKCVASQSKSTFFSISASSLTSKWVGDGEKMVRALFAVSRCHQPAVIFIDEIDSLLSQRSDSEHESSRRIKTEFLVQLDGATTDNDERILVIGATNRPQELDEAARRRFVKRLYIPLPEMKARVQLVQRLMSSERHSLSPENINEVSRLSDGYSGADMRNLCSDACLGPIRSINMSQIENIQANEVRAVTMDDFKKSLTRVRSSVSSNDLNQYIQWDKTYGSGCF